MGLLGLSFLNPLFLLGLLGLPLIWFLLRITPPQPRKQPLPTIRFLRNLLPKEKTPVRTPWWLLLLRIIIAGLIITALARPVLNPGESISGIGPVRLVIDNSWPSGQIWETQLEKAKEILSHARYEERPVYIMTTALSAKDNAILHEGPLSPAGAEELLNQLTPLPWPADHEAGIRKLLSLEINETVTSLWLGHGIWEEGYEKLAQALQNQGRLFYFSPDSENDPLLLNAKSVKPPDAANPLRTIIEAEIKNDFGISESRNLRVDSIGRDGSVLDRIDFRFDENGDVLANIDLPDELYQELATLKVTGMRGAGNVYLLDGRHRRKTVGILSSGADSDTAPLVEANYYLKNALQPYAEIVEGNINTLIETDPAMIVFSDFNTTTPENLDKIEKWINAGGLLVQFAGSSYLNNTNVQLVPVDLRQGGRALDGSMTWADPPRIEKFTENSPFKDLSIPKDVTVRRMVLADPSANLEEKTWAVLTDGTPLITAERRENGMIVLIHTTATPEWSNLALSGLYIQILKRLSETAKGSMVAVPQKENSYLNPLTILDGFGNMRKPDATVSSITLDRLKQTQPSPETPPGIYGQDSFTVALNLGERIEAPKKIKTMPPGVDISPYEKAKTVSFMPFLLLMAIVLFLADWLITIILSGMNIKRLSVSLFRKTASPAVLAIQAAVFCSLLPIHGAYAASQEAHIRYATELHLAYVKSGDAAVDRTSRQGLENLARMLTLRTSVEPAGVVGLNLEEDPVNLFPLIYWAVTPAKKTLTNKEAQTLQTFLDNGGMVLFDTRDQPRQSASSFGMALSENAKTLQALLAPLNIPELVPVTQDHVLTKSFYLLDTFPGRYEGGTLWVEKASLDAEKRTGLDGVSGIIIGGNDWGSAWAENFSRAGFSRYNLSGGSRQQEMAFRFGINLMMYALTGNYKSDQVHLPFILDRLGQ